MLVYKCPGPHFGPYGKTYKYKSVSEEFIDEVLKDGWHKSLLSACDKRKENIETVLSGVDDTGRRAREDDGTYRADDPTTPENEAYIEEPKKKKRGRKKKDK